MPIVVNLSAATCTPFTSASYTTLKGNVASWVARDDLTSIIPTFIDHAVSRINRKLRIRPMERAFSIALDADGRTSIPCDFIAIRDAYLFQRSGTLPTGGGTSPPYLLTSISNVVPLEVTTPENLYADWEAMRNRGRAKIAEVGSALVVNPYISASPNLGGMYYARFQPLSDSNPSNWITQNVPELILYGACLEAAVYTKDKAMMGYWGDAFGTVIAEVELEHKSARLSGSSLQPALRVF